jgi:hypothetical protein
VVSRLGLLPLWRGRRSSLSLRPQRSLRSLGSSASGSLGHGLGRGSPSSRQSPTTPLRSAAFALGGHLSH